jgi:hypothetical protein
MADHRLMAQYPKQACVRDRNMGGLVAWAGYITAEAVPPTKPDEEWVRERIVAEQIPLNPQVYVDRTMSYFLQDPQTETNVRDYLSEWNSEAQEAALCDQIQAVISAFMPRFAAADVSDAQVQQWYDQNGYPAPEPPPPPMPVSRA